MDPISLITLLNTPAAEMQKPSNLELATHVSMVVLRQNQPNQLSAEELAEYIQFTDLIVNNRSSIMTNIRTYGRDLPSYSNLNHQWKQFIKTVQKKLDHIGFETRVDGRLGPNTLVSMRRAAQFALMNLNLDALSQRELHLFIDDTRGFEQYIGMSETLYPGSALLTPGGELR